MDLNFRTLTASEIECRADVVGNFIEISLHNKAHTCTSILNEVVGPMNWEKEYTNGNKNCVVRIWDKDKKMMISKEDCGGPLTDKDGHKGQASNGFKRVCALGWGLGIELYSQPQIKLPRTDANVTYDNRNNVVVSEEYSVALIEYSEERQITRCQIVNRAGQIVYDGPDENGGSRVTPPVEEEEQLVIPENADMLNDEHSEIEDDDVIANTVVDQEDSVEELPDNTDGYEDAITDAFMEQKMPFSKTDYAAELDFEITRTHVRKADVLKKLGISSLDEIDTVDEDLVEETLNKLKGMETR